MFRSRSAIAKNMVGRSMLTMLIRRWEGKVERTNRRLRVAEKVHYHSAISFTICSTSSSQVLCRNSSETSFSYIEMEIEPCWVRMCVESERENVVVRNDGRFETVFGVWRKNRLPVTTVGNVERGEQRVWTKGGWWEGEEWNEIKENESICWEVHVLGDGVA